MQSNQYLNWKSNLDFKTCKPCKDLHGKIYEDIDQIYPEPPLHENCRCVIVPVEALLAGTATDNGTGGADWWLKHYGRLPGYYIAGKMPRLLGGLII